MVEQEYDWSKCPSPQDGSVLPVKFHFYVNKIGDINSVSNTALIDIGIAFIWKDYRLVGHTEEKELPSNLWGPHITLWNTEGVPDVIRKDFVLLNSKEGKLTRTYRFVTRVMNEKHPSFKLFPFDFNKVTMKMTQASIGCLYDGTLCEDTGGKILYELEPVSAEDEELLFRFWAFTGKLNEWKLVGMSHISEVEGTVQSLRVDFHFHRKSGYYGWKVVLPLMLLSAMSFLVFVFPVEEVGERLNYTLTAFLAAFALLYVISSDIPKTGTLTRIDKMIVVSIISMLLSAIFSWAAFVISTRDGLDVAKEYNLYGAIILVALFSIAVVYLLITPYIKQKVEIKRMDEIERATDNYVPMKVIRKSIV